MDPERVARAVLDAPPEPKRFLAPNWRWQGTLSVAAPRLADRALAGKLGDEQRRS